MRINNGTLRIIQNRWDPVVVWLCILAVLVFCMIVLGGITRLTHSGLSMVEWKPFLGFLPPLSEAQWWNKFYQYQTYSEYKLVNYGIELAEFKDIYLLEFMHRFLGRIIAIAFVIPLSFFLYKKRLNQRLIKPLLFVFFLVFLQGALGWYMVKSGLADEPTVSAYRLVAHLGLAVALYGYLISLAYRIHSKSINTSSPRNLGPLVLVSTIYLMILSGGLVAGNHAGLVWNTFPLMGNTLFPAGLFEMSPVWLSVFEDPTTVQFNHRVLAAAILVITLIYIIKRMYFDLSNKKGRYLFIAFIFVLLCQISLGIITLLQHVPLEYAVLHQANAIALFTLAILIFHQSQESILIDKSTQ
ncbi:MAG: cytochrome c oxidase assembly protein subunit 15 [Oleiphilaceae bacterium]|jgi:cytochrome c oxidase assembly protein subunit 15